MKRLLAVMLVSLFGAVSASAMLKTEDKAPDFTVEAALGGKTFSFHLADALKRDRSSSISTRSPSPRAARSRRMISPTTPPISPPPAPA